MRNIPWRVSTNFWPRVYIIKTTSIIKKHFSNKHVCVILLKAVDATSSSSTPLTMVVSSNSCLNCSFFLLVRTSTCSSNNFSFSWRSNRAADSQRWSLRRMRLVSDQETSVDFTYSREHRYTVRINTMGGAEKEKQVHTGTVGSVVRNAD